MFACNHVAVYFISRALRSSLESSRAALRTDRLNPGDELVLDIAIELPAVFPPAVKAYYYTYLEFPDRPPLIAHTGLHPGINETSITSTPQYRGYYCGPETLIMVTDLFGFSKRLVRLDEELSVRVRPDPEYQVDVDQRIVSGGEVSPSNDRKERSEDYLEARKYFPGDDIRRLNWNQYAHSGKLFIRIGEEIPPPESRLLCVLDTSGLSGIADTGFRADYIDILTELFSSVVFMYIKNGTQVSVLVPGNSVIHKVDTTALSSLYDELSEVTVHSPVHLEKIENASGPPVFIVTSPLSDMIANRAYSRFPAAARASVLIKKADVKKPQNPTIMDFVIRKSQTGIIRQLIRNREHVRLYKQMEAAESSAAYEFRQRGMKNVKEI